MDIDKELIILAGPPTVDKYYGDIKSELRDFHIAYAKQIAEHDDVLVLVVLLDTRYKYYQHDYHADSKSEISAKSESTGSVRRGGP